MATETLNLDYDMLEELKEIMEDEFLELLKVFLSDSETRIKGLHAALRDQEQDQLRRIAHSFKGSSGNIGAHALSQLCKELEESAKAGKIEISPALVENIESEFSTVSSKILEIINAS